MDYTWASPTLANQSHPLEPGQMAGEGWLANRSQDAQFVYTPVPMAECVQNLDANRVSQRF